MIQPRKQAWVKWRNLVSEQEKSGQRVAAYCRSREVPESHFYYWKRRLKQTAATPPFVEVQVAKPELRPSHSPLGSAIEVRLSNGRSLLVAPSFDASHLGALLAVVESES
jgi:hypothetical protein